MKEFILHSNTEYRNARFSESYGVQDTNYIDCDILIPESGWMPTSLPADQSDPLNAEVVRKILSEVSNSDLSRVLRDGKLVSLSSEDKEEISKSNLLKAKDQLLSTLSFTARDKITSGFYSNATGQIRSYGSTETDQRNLLSSILTGRSSYVACSYGKWSRVLHSQEELKGVLQSFEDFKFLILSRLDKLRCEVEEADTTDALDVISW